MTRYGVPFWLSGRPAHVPAWPRQRGETTVDIAIVGGGLTGCAVAYSFAAAGFSAALLEADRVGRAATAAGDGILSLEPWSSWRDQEHAFGRRDARLIRENYRHAALDFAATLRRLRIRCDLTPQRSACVALADDAEAALRRDAAARKEAGLTAVWLEGRRLRQEIGAERGAGLFTADALTFDPYRACLGFARAAAARGCEIFESSLVAGARRRADGIDLQCRSGVVHAQAVVSCSGAPLPFARKVARYFRPTMMHHVVTPALPAALRKAMGAGEAVVRFAGVPARRLRWTSNHQAIFSGGDHSPVPARSRERAVVQRTGQLMYELSLVYPAISGVQPEAGWDVALAETSDGMPCIGAHRAYPRHLFALGADRAGAASAWLAARLLLRHVTGAPAKGDELFGFGRLRT